jgi:hemoglobin/transferrin/lactoferrin receptor protein
MKIILLLLPLITLSNFSFANKADTLRQDSTIHLEGVVVTATRNPVSNFEVSEFISELNHVNILQLSPMSTPDLISNIAGVWMQKTNHGGGSPYVRGLTGYHTLLVMDGIRINNAVFRSGPNQYLNTIDPYILEGVEVLHGQGSVQYGSDGIGGTLQLFSRALTFSKNDWNFNGNVSAQFLSDDMEKTSRVELAGSGKRLSFLADFTHKDFGNIVAGGNLGVLAPTGYNEHSWDIKSKIKINLRSELTLLHQHVEQHEVPIYHQLVTGKFIRHHTTLQQRDINYVRLESQYKSALINKIQYTIAHQSAKEIREKELTDSDILRTEIDNINSISAAVEITTKPYTNWSAVSGAEFYNDAVNSRAHELNKQTEEEISVRGLYPNKSNQSSIGYYSLHTLNLRQFVVTASARYNKYYLTVKEANFGKTNLKPSALIGNVGIVYKFLPTLHVVASAGTGFRAPNINDVSTLGIADARYEIPNYELSPEKSFQHQVGLKHNSNSGFVALYMYQNSLTDMIVNNPSAYNGEDSVSGFQVYQRFNTDKALVKGVELEVQQNLSTCLKMLANLTYTHGYNTTKNEPISRIPPLFGRIGLNYQKKRFTTSIEYVVAGKQDRLSGGDKKDSRIAQGGTPGWQVANVRFQYKRNFIRIGVGIQNIFNEAYRVHGSGVDGLGRNYLLTTAFNF